MYSPNHQSNSGSHPCNTCRYELITGIAPDEMACIICGCKRNWHQTNKLATSDTEDLLSNPTISSHRHPNAFTYFSDK